MDPGPESKSWYISEWDLGRTSGLGTSGSGGKTNAAAAAGTRGSSFDDMTCCLLAWCFRLNSEVLELSTVNISFFLLFWEGPLRRPLFSSIFHFPHASSHSSFIPTFRKISTNGFSIVPATMY